MMLGNYGKQMTAVQNRKLSKYVMDMALKLPFPKKTDLCNCGYYDGLHLPISENESCIEFSDGVEKGLEEILDSTYEYTKNQMNPDDDKSRPEYERANIHALTGVWV